MSEYIYVKLLKKWGGFAIGEVVRFGVNKGEGRIAKGEGVRVEEPKEIETAAMKRAAAVDVKAKLKAKAEAEQAAKEKAAAEAKADAEKKTKVDVKAKAKVRPRKAKKGG